MQLQAIQLLRQWRVAPTPSDQRMGWAAPSAQAHVAPQEGLPNFLGACACISKHWSTGRCSLQSDATAQLTGCLLSCRAAQGQEGTSRKAPARRTAHTWHGYAWLPSWLAAPGPPCSGRSHASCMRCLTAIESVHQCMEVGDESRQALTPLPPAWLWPAPHRLGAR